MKKNIKRKYIIYDLPSIQNNSILLERIQLNHENKFNEKLKDQLIGINFDCEKFNNLKNKLDSSIEE